MLPVVLRLRGGGYPKYIVDDAALLNNDHETVKSEFHGLYNDILRYWFPSTQGYQVSPHWIIPDPTKDQYITFVIKCRRSREPPLLLLEVKPPSDLTRIRKGKLPSPK
jgi:hypothetical protein